VGVDDIGLVIAFDVALPPEDHARLLQQDRIVKFPPPENLDNNHC
jgi:hypothetical protein